MAYLLIEIHRNVLTSFAKFIEIKGVRKGEEIMKILKILLVLLIMQFLMGQAAVYSETIYTKEDEEIQAKITEVTESAVWYELTSGDMTEYIGIDKADVVKILKDDGTVYSYPIKEEKEENAR